jgi:hypothetical protein
MTTACKMANAQYTGDPQCEAACTILSNAMLGGMDTIACRATHATAATMMGGFGTGPVPGCWQAGPFSYGGCGDECEAFCALATHVCPNAYASMAACQLACELYIHIPADPSAYTAKGPTSGNYLACREYYTMAALADQTQCPNVAKVSPTCM